MEFEKLITDVKESVYAVDYGDYVVIQGNTTTIVLNKDSNEYKVFNSCNYSIEDDFIYLMTYEGDFLSSEIVLFKI